MTPLTPVPFTHVQIDDAFWSPRLETNRLVTLPAEYEMLERTGRLAAWDGDWRAGDPNPPHIFWDSDIAKWIEAASYALAAHPDPALDARLDALIARLARLQQPDGYVNAHYLLVEPGRRWTNLRDKHELYCAGHLIEAAVAHHRATGKRSLLDIACRYADHIDATFGRGPGRLRGYPGHEEIELALVRLYHVTGERRYLDLARYFVDERGAGATVTAPAATPVGAGFMPARPSPHQHYFDSEAVARGEDPRAFWARSYAYMQADRPVREQAAVEGHAVRAMYLYSAMADLAREFDDAGLLAACERLWRSVCEQQMYLTGGIGQTGATEGFSGPYDLPDETAYAETCAAIGLVFWNRRMLHLTGDGRYVDVMERALYNGALSGVSLDGTRFFYDNPLATRVPHPRSEWFDCACCPPNLARLLASLGGYIYSTGERDAWIDLYVQSRATLDIGLGSLEIRQRTCYPWDGAVKLELHMDAPRDFTLHLRVPGWCDHWHLYLNGTTMPQTVASLSQNYVHLTRTWSPGDVVALDLAMPVRYVFAHPSVTQLAGRVALQRGPLVYCLEGVDHAGVPLERIAVCATEPAHRVFRAEHVDGQALGLPVPGGLTVLRGHGQWLADDDPALYRFSPPRAQPLALTAVPYCFWANRTPGPMRVWLRQQ